MPMPPNASTALKQLLDAFAFTLTGGYARTVGSVMDLLTTLAVIELIIAGVGWMFLRWQMFLELLWKLVGFGFLFWLVQEWPVLLKLLRDEFIRAGLAIGDSVVTLDDILDPGNLIDFGFAVTATLLKDLSKMGWLHYSFTVLFAGLSGWAVVLFYAIMAAHVFKALLEYYIVSACLLFLVPFLAFQKTAFIGERVFATLIAHALRLMVYATVLSIALPVYMTWQLTPDATFGQVMLLLTLTLVFFIIALGLPALASGMVHGQGVWSMANLLAGTQSFLETGAAISGVRAAVSIARAAGLRGAAGMAGAMAEAAHIGAARNRAAGGVGMRASVVGGVQGVGRYSFERLRQSYRTAYQQGRTRATNTMP